MTETLGVRGPLGLIGVVRLSSEVKLGRMQFANSPLLFGSDDETNGEMLRSIESSKLKIGRPRLISLGGLRVLGRRPKWEVLLRITLFSSTTL